MTSANTGAMLYQLSYEATHWERGQFIEFISYLKIADHLAELKRLRDNYASMLMNKVRSIYLTNPITENSLDQHMLFETVNFFLSDSKSLSLSNLKSLPIIKGTTRKTTKAI